MLRLLYIILLFLAINQYILTAQCGCVGGAAVGTIVQSGSSSNSGILSKNNFKTSLFFVNSFGDEYFKGDKKLDSGVIKSFNTSYLGLQFEYGLFDRFTLETQIGYYVDKYQDFGAYTKHGNGFSNITIIGKYNLYKSRTYQVEWTLGAGVSIPLDRGDKSLPQHLRASSGASSVSMISYLHKGYKKNQLNFILLNKYDYNFENSDLYLYGNNFTNSFYISKGIVDKLSAVIGLRTDYRAKDKYDGYYNYDSGWFQFNVSPQINYSLYNINIGIYYDIPLYKYYNGTQLTNKGSIGLSISKDYDLFSTKDK